MTLSGWTIADNVAQDTLPGLTLAAGGLVVVAARPANFLENYPAYSGPLVGLGEPIGNGLANDGDRLLLRDAAGRLVDALSYGNDTSVFAPAIPAVPARGYSLERRPLGRNTHSAGDFQAQPHPSPGEGWDATEPGATPSSTPSVTATLAPTASSTPRATASATPTAETAATITATATATAGRCIVLLPIIVFDRPPTPTATATPDPRLVTLNELLPAPDAIDWNEDGKVDSGDEWVELYNAASTALDVSGWALDDEADAGSPLYFLPAGTVIPAHRFLLLFGKQTGLNLANTKDVVRLLYRNGALLEEYRYYATWKDRSFCKTADGGQVWTYWYPPSPGEPNRP